MGSSAKPTSLRQNTPAWIDGRRDFIGSSDLPVLTGNGIYATSIFSLWAIKTRLAEPEPIDPDTQELFDLGHALEDDIAEQYTAKTGRPVRQAKLMRVRKDLPWAAASLDRVSAVKGERRIVEAKWLPHRSWFHEPERIPSYVQDQVQWQLFVTGYDVADVAVLDGSKVYVHEVTPNEEYQADLLYIAGWFRGLVERGEPPPVDGSEATRMAIARLHPRPTLDLMEPTPEITALAQDFRDARIGAKKLEEERDRLGNMIRLVLGEHQGVEGDDFRLSWLKNADSSRTDWETVAGAYRRLLERIAANFEPARELGEGSLEEQIAAATPVDLADVLAAIEPLYTRTTEGARVLRARFRDEETGKWT